MVDMGQCDSSLRQRPLSEQNRMCWTRALTLAAKEMGYIHYFDVPENEDEALRSLALSLIKGRNDEVRKHNQQP